MNDMVDMSQFVEAKSDQLNADDLIGSTRTITVRRVTGNDGDQPVSIFYEGDNNKPFKPCKTMRRVLLAIWGKHASDYVGRSMTLYRDDKVTFGGLDVGGIRISHMSHLDKETIVVVMKTKGKKAGIKVQPLKVEQGQRGEDPAVKWANAYIAKVETIETIEDLAAFDLEKRAKLTELAQKRPELHESCVNAARARGAALSADGRVDEDFGDGFTDEAND